jgi:hypothetical protein
MKAARERPGPPACLIFLQRETEEKARQPEIKLALYFFRRAHLVWNKRLESELTAKGLGQSNADLSLWILQGEHGDIVAIYGDDGLVAARTLKKLMRP